jgi:hypothetical protein
VRCRAPRVRTHRDARCHASPYPAVAHRRARSLRADGPAQLRTGAAALGGRSQRQAFPHSPAELGICPATAQRRSAPGLRTEPLAMHLHRGELHA